MRVRRSAPDCCSWQLYDWLKRDSRLVCSNIPCTACLPRLLYLVACHKRPSKGCLSQGCCLFLRQHQLRAGPDFQSSRGLIDRDKWSQSRAHLPPGCLLTSLYPSQRQFKIDSSRKIRRTLSERQRGWRGPPHLHRLLSCQVSLEPC